MNSAEVIRDCLFARMRSAPYPFTVKGSLPVVCFGDLHTAQVATVGLNPSPQEYVDRSHRELEGDARRFETLNSLGASDRESLTDEQCDRALTTMRSYFHSGKPIYSWFRSLNRFMLAMGYSYEAGEVAHLDLVQESTHPAWSALKQQSPSEAESLLKLDLPFLHWELSSFPLRVAVCNGRTVLDNVSKLVAAERVSTGMLRRITWYTAVGVAGGRQIGVVGWNLPLARPTGLGKEGETLLGELLRDQLRDSSSLQWP